MCNKDTLEFQLVVWQLITERIADNNVNFFKLSDSFCKGFKTWKRNDPEAEVWEFMISDDVYFYNVTINRLLGDISFKRKSTKMN